MEQVSMSVQLKDALFLASVRFTQEDGSPLFGKVEEIEKDPLTGEYLYLVRFTDGSVQHVTAEEVRTHRFPENPRFYTCDYVPESNGHRRFKITAMSGAEVANVVFSRAPTGLELRFAVTRKTKAKRGTFVLLSVESDIIHDCLKFDDASATWQMRS